jgi:regulatory protein
VAARDRAPVDARARALARLARRDHSEQELRRALRRDGFPPDVVDEVLGRLRAERYLDDQGYAARFARSRLAHHGLGRRRVQAALARKGVARPAIAAGLGAALAEVSEQDSLDALARRYWRSHAQDEPARRLRKLWAFLCRRGFPPGMVHDRLRALWPRWRDALEGLDAADD